MDTLLTGHFRNRHQPSRSLCRRFAKQTKNAVLVQEQMERSISKSVRLFPRSDIHFLSSSCFFFHVWLSRIIFGGFFSFLQEIFWSSLRPTATSLRKFHIRGSGESLLKPELFFSQAGIWCHNKMSSNI